MVREKSLENERFPGQRKVREFQFQSGKFGKNEKSQGFPEFSKKVHCLQASEKYIFL